MERRREVSGSATTQQISTVGRRRVVAVVGGNDVHSIIELLSRAKTQEILILVKGKGKWYEEWYTRHQNFFKQAEEKGLLRWGDLQPAIAI